jgi:predicted deacylase
MRVSRRLIDVTGMSDIIQRRIPVLTLDSKLPGPNIWLTGCIHGDEPGGAVVIHEVVRAVRKCGLSGGAIHALPLVNSMGFENVSRFINTDREDLNRCFPGDPKGTMGERIAHRLFELIAGTGPDLVIDLHNDWIQSVPYLLIEPPELFMRKKQRAQTTRLAAATGLLLVQDPQATPELRRTLTGALVSKGVCAFTLEGGGAGSIVESSIAAGRTAVLGVLSRLGILNAEPGTGLPEPSSQQVLDYTSRPLCASSGIVRYAVLPGDEVETGQTVARVYSAFGSLEETLRAEKAGIVLGVADHARTVPGTEIIAIAEKGVEKGVRHL